MRAGAQHRRPLGRRDPARGQRADLLQHAQDPGHPDAYPVFVEAQPLARLVEQHVDPLLARGMAQRARPQRRLEDDRRAEGAGEVVEPGLARRDADLRIIRPVHRRGMQVDPEIRPRDDLGHEQMRQPRGERAPARAGTAAVEVAPVRQVARTGQEAEGVDDGHHHERPAQRFQRLGAQQAAHDLHADDLVAMHPRGDEDHRPGAAAVDHLHRHGDLGVIRHHRDRQVDDLAASRRDPRVADLECAASGHASVTLVGLRACCLRPPPCL
jgi:hypothetical protein